MPSRTDVPEYAEYLERIEALVAVVNHRHGTPDWMPIDLKLRDDLEEAVASYKHYDVIMVNAMFDGMNLVAKEAALVNERDGVSILSENTGAHEELGEWSLSVNPFDVQELADSLHAALTMPAEERARPGGGAQGGPGRARPGRLGGRADLRHPPQGARRGRRGGRAGAAGARGRLALERSKANSGATGGGGAYVTAGGGASHAAPAAGTGAPSRGGSGRRARRPAAPSPAGERRRGRSGAATGGGGCRDVASARPRRGGSSGSTGGVRRQRRPGDDEHEQARRERDDADVVPAHAREELVSHAHPRSRAARIRPPATLAAAWPGKLPSTTSPSCSTPRPRTSAARRSSRTSRV